MRIWSVQRVTKRRKLADAAAIGVDDVEGRRTASRACSSPTRKKSMAAAARGRGISTATRRSAQLEIPLDTEPAITFQPVPAGQASTRRAPRAMRRAGGEPRTATVRVTSAARRSGVRAGHRAVVADRAPQGDVDRSHEDVSRPAQALRRAAPLRRDADRGARARAGGPGRPRAEGRTVPRPAARHPVGRQGSLRHQGHPDDVGREAVREPGASDIDATVVERLRDAGAVLVAKLSMGSLAQGGVWFGGTTRNPWAPETGSSGSSAGPAPRPPPAWSASRSAPKPAARSSRRRASAASSVCGRPTDASAATARWRSAGRWTRSDRCAGASKTARSCSTRSTAPTAATTRSSTRRSSGSRRAVVEAAHRLRREGVRTASLGESQREPRNLLKDALDVLRAQRREARTDRAAGLPHRRDQFHPRRRSGGGLRRSDAQQGDRSAHRAGTGGVAEHVPDVALHPGRRIHPRPARADAARSGRWTR